jgi:multimeric flavodoxin WrbA
MKIAIVSYSLTGNNEALAASVAKELAVKHIKITEAKHRSMFTTILDMVFNRIPKVNPGFDCLKEYELILFFGPVWMGKVATPLRRYLQEMKTNSCTYGFISISGGADGINPDLEQELSNRAGASPVVLVDLHIADILAFNTKPSRKDTSAYKIKQEDIKKLTCTILNTCKGIL